LKFLGFEQTFKNSLTTLRWAVAKGEATSTPAARVTRDPAVLPLVHDGTAEVHRDRTPTFLPGTSCVGAREIGYLYGQYKRIRGENTGVLTGKGLGYGGSLIRPEATGFGTMYFADELLKEHHDEFTGKRVSLSGFGNVAWGAAMKASQLGAKVVTISGRTGMCWMKRGWALREMGVMQRLRASNQDVVAPYARQIGAKFVPERTWEVPVDMLSPAPSRTSFPWSMPSSWSPMG
jgi:glutamate dehydrogenase (NADP+)